MVKNDRQTVLILLLVVLIVLILFIIAGGGRKEKEKKDGYGQYGNNRTESYAGKKAEAYYDTGDGTKAELFTFDPNTADSTALLRLGLSPRIVRNIYRYRGKGGVFSHPEDFAKLWGLTAGQYRKLLPYIRIGEDYRPASEVYGRATHYDNNNGGNHSLSYNQGNAYAGTGDTTKSSHNAKVAQSAYPQKLRSGETMDINSADTTALARIPGIGRYFARQIARYRDRLGGYVSKEQLAEIDGFPESALPYININGSAIRKIRINTATNEQLRKHPYIDFRQARDILDYRRLRGRIRNLDDLRATRAFTDNMLQKLAPYIDFD